MIKKEKFSVLKKSFERLEYVAANASVDPWYLWCAVKDLGWGVQVLCGVKFQAQYPVFDIINTPQFGVVLVFVGIAALCNFGRGRDYVVTIITSAFNALFIGYLVYGFFCVGDGAIMRNCWDLVFVLWLVIRVQWDNAHLGIPAEKIASTEASRLDDTATRP